MKKMIVLSAMLAMMTGVAQAQEDFYNDYIMIMTGTMDPFNDPNGGSCGSGFYFNAILEDGSQAPLVPMTEVGGPGVHQVNGRLIFSSRNKVKGLYVWTRNENRSSTGGCKGSNFEGTLPFTPVYPCHEQNHLLQAPHVAYDFYVHVSIQPLSKKKSQAYH